MEELYLGLSVLARGSPTAHVQRDGARCSGRTVTVKIFAGMAYVMRRTGQGGSDQVTGERDNCPSDFGGNCSSHRNVLYSYSRRERRERLR